MIEEFRRDALSTFDGLPVRVFAWDGDEDPPRPEIPADVEAFAWRVGVDEYGDANSQDIFPLFLEHVDTTRIRALILAAWDGDVSGEDVDKFQAALAAAADRFPALEALFVSDIPQDLSEISWIEQRDPTALIAAFPRLRVLGLRGGIEGPFEPLNHAGIEELVMQSGGLAPRAVRAVAASNLPALASLDLYLGITEYGGGATSRDLEPILSGAAFPALRHLGLRDAQDADELAAALAHAPVVAQLTSLNLSLGTLSDVGAAALLAGQPLTHLKQLDLHHHFLSDAMMERLRQELPGVELDLAEQQEPDSWGHIADGDRELFRYVAVSE
ncbi:STM4015 family protein [Actinospica robiniae]|uniref:STM4015 family protein n=1 Tax=Actinospica robiniae TaxID=304901 RepID=UPI0004295967|nr:STM4015 family protein [Actinospica robiniae]